MQRALVVVGDTNGHRQLLREAGELAAGSDADLLLLSLIERGSIDDSHERFARAEGVSAVEAALEDARRTASTVAEEVLMELDMDYEIAAAVVEAGEAADEIVATARREDCDQVFIVGRKRSPTGKAVFGDVAQGVILSFEGPVTALTAR
jgi:nucleotide-binding universal stress UspA family protein